MTQEELYRHPGWADCTFAGARRQVLRLGLKRTFREKLQWLEEAETLTFHLRTNRANRAAAKTKARNSKRKAASSRRAQLNAKSRVRK